MTTLTDLITRLEAATGPDIELDNGIVHNIQHYYPVDPNEMPLPNRCCGRCQNWARLAPEDETAPEGRCGL